MAEALRYDDPEKQLQFYSSHNGTPTYYGQGTGHDDEQANLRRFLRQVDQAVAEENKDSPALLVLVGVDYLKPIYDEVSSSPHLLKDSVSTNPDVLSAQSLHEMTWPVAARYFDQKAATAKEQFETLTAVQQTTADLKDCLNAAHDGQIETLFIAQGQQ